MKSVICVALAAVCLVAPAQQQKPGVPKQKRPIPPPMEYGVAWSRSKLSPLAVAEATDKSLGNQKGIHARYGIQIWYGPLMFGGSYGELKLRDRRHYVLEFENLHYSQDRNDVPAEKMNAIANGAEVRLIGSRTKESRNPIALFHIDTSSKASDWVTGLPRYMYGGINGETALKDLVAKAMRPGSGFKVSVGERSVPYKGRQLRQQRLLIERTPEAAKIEGPARMAITIDVKRQLPVSARVDSNERKGKALIYILAIGWPSRPEKFSDKDFTFPAKK